MNFLKNLFKRKSKIQEEIYLTTVENTTKNENFITNIFEEIKAKNNFNYLVLDNDYSDFFTFQNTFEELGYKVNVFQYNNINYNPFIEIKTDEDFEVFCDSFLFALYLNDENSLFPMRQNNMDSFGYAIKTLFFYVYNKQNPTSLASFLENILKCFDVNKNLKKEVLEDILNNDKLKKYYYLYKKSIINNINHFNILHLGFNWLSFLASKNENMPELNDYFKQEKQAIILENVSNDFFVNLIYTIAINQLDNKWEFISLKNSTFISDENKIEQHFKSEYSDIEKFIMYSDEDKYKLYMKNIYVKNNISPETGIYNKNICENAILVKNEKIEEIIKKKIDYDLNSLDPCFTYAHYKKINNTTFCITILENLINEIKQIKLVFYKNDFYLGKDNLVYKLNKTFDLINFTYDKILNEEDVYNNKEIFFGDILKNYKEKSQIFVLYLYLKFPLLEKMTKINIFNKHITTIIISALNATNLKTYYIVKYKTEISFPKVICSKLENDVKTMFNEKIASNLYNAIELEHNGDLYKGLNISKYALKKIQNIADIESDLTLLRLIPQNNNNDIFNHNLFMYNKHLNIDNITRYNDALNNLHDSFSDSEILQFRIKFFKKLATTNNEFRGQINILSEIILMYNILQEKPEIIKTIDSNASLERIYRETIETYRARGYENYGKFLTQLNVEIKKDLSRFVYENDNFIIITPKNTYEIKTEGEMLNHCAGTYVKRILSNVTNIVFIREKSNIAKPFYTAQVNDNGEIIQIHGKCNCNVDANPRLEEFVQDWMKKCGLYTKDYNKRV